MRALDVLLAIGLTAGLVAQGAAPAQPQQVAAVTTPMPGPPIREDPTKLAASLSCTPGVATSSRPTVLLVPGTLTSPDQDWGKNLAIQLPKQGYPTCMVAQPTHGLNDMQVSVEYVVSAVRSIFARSSRKLAVIGHSQGAFLATYALRFWPDLALKISDFIGYAGTYTYGFDLAETLCTAICTEALQQFRPGSRLLTGVAAQPLPSGPAYTAYSTNIDEMVQPQPLASTLHAPGARNYVLQDLCPQDLAEHLLVPFEKPFLALTLDALRNPGPGTLERIGRAPCGLLSGAPQAVPGLVTAVVLGAVTGVQNPATTEPPLRCYVDANCPKPRLQPTLHAHTARPTATTYRTTGRLLLPPGATDQCSGQVVVRLVRLRSTISHRVVPIRLNCTYSARQRGPRQCNLTVVARFRGNAELLPAEALGDSPGLSHGAKAFPPELRRCR